MNPPAKATGARMQQLTAIHHSRREKEAIVFMGQGVESRLYSKRDMKESNATWVGFKEEIRPSLNSIRPGSSAQSLRLKELDGRQ